MSLSTLAGAVTVLAAISRVSAHGTVSGIVIDGAYYRGYSPSFQYANPAPVVVGWSSPEDLDNGFVAPSAYSDPDIICHKGATPGQTHAEVAAGGSIDLQWTDWPESHHGPVLDYLANCNGPCESVDKTALEFFKIDAGGLIDGTTAPGTWASDQLIANNNTWTVKIPSDIAPGNYVLRHEIIALHSAGSLDGAQNYPQCINLAITGDGTATPAGVVGTALYKDTDPGILVGIYSPLSTYVIPGPAVYTAGAALVATKSATASSTIAEITTKAVAASSSAASQVPSPTSASSALPASASDSSVLPTSTSASSVVLASPIAPFLNSTISRVIGRPTQVTTRHSRPVSTATTRPEGPANTSSLIVVVSKTIEVDSDTASATSAAISQITSANPVATSATLDAPSSTRAASGSKPTDTAVPVMPAGTTFKTLMEWTKNVVQEIAGGNTALMGRRHARALTA